MAETENVAEFPKPLPDHVVIRGAGDIRMSPNEMRALKVETGRTMSDLMGDDENDADRMQAVVWLRLRREGFPVSWDDAGDVSIQFAEDEPPDPTNENG